MSGLYDGTIVPQSRVEALLKQLIENGGSGGNGGNEGGDSPQTIWDEYVDIVRRGEARDNWEVGDEIYSTFTYQDPRTGEDVTVDNPWIVVGFEDGVELENGDIYDDVPVLQMKYLWQRPPYASLDEVPATEEHALEGYYYYAYETNAYSDGVELNEVAVDLAAIR